MEYSHAKMGYNLFRDRGKGGVKEGQLDYKVSYLSNLDKEITRAVDKISQKDEKEDLEQKITKKAEPIINLQKNQDDQKNLVSLIKQKLERKNELASKEQQQISKQDLQNLVRQFPQFDLNNLDSQNLDYIAHLLNLCECFKCECNTCKCTYAQNVEKPKYGFYDLTTTNQAAHHLVTLIPNYLFSDPE